MKRVVALAVVALGASVAAPADAQQGGSLRPVVRLAVDPCVDVASDDVERGVDLELGSQPDAAATSRDATVVHVACDGARVVLHVDDAVTGKSVERAVEPPPSLDARSRARLLALAIAELVTSSWSELATGTPSPLPLARPLASPEARQTVLHVLRVRVPALARRTRGATWYLAAAVGVRAFANAAGLLPTAGLGVRLGVDARAGYGFALDFDADYARSGSDVGRIDGLTASAAAMAYAHGRTHHWTFRAGAGARLGFAELTGTPAMPTRTLGRAVVGVWGGPLIALGAGRTIARRVRMDVWLEGGYAFAGVDAGANGRVLTGVDGVWTGLALAFAVLP